jgi:hypothetical protein
MSITLSPNQSRYLAGVFSTPLFYVNPNLRQVVLDAYFNQDDPDDIPAALDPNIKLTIQYGLATGEKFVELKTGDMAEAVAQTPSPFPGETEEIED